MLSLSDLVVWNNKVRLEDKHIVGQEIASLGEISHHDVPILHRIVITPFAYAAFLEENNLKIQIKHLLGSINHDRHDSVMQVARHIQNLITHAPIGHAIYNPVFKLMEKIDTKSVALYAHYFKDGKMIGSATWRDLSGESVLVEHIRVAFAHLFSTEYLGKHTIHHLNHSSFSVCLFVEPDEQFDLTGHIETAGKVKGEYEVEAHSLVRFSYNKHSGSITRGEVLGNEGKSALSPKDLRKLLLYAKNSEEAFYLPQVIFWGKFHGDFLVTKILPSADVPIYHDTYHALIQNVTVHPGVTIGRLKVVDERSRNVVVSSDEIILVKKLDKGVIEAVKKAKGLIIEEDPMPEMIHALKSLGIPAIVKKDNRFLYSTGDVISLNATTGEIKRGSMLVS